MANTLITPQTIARMGIATLYAQTQMAGLVYRDYSGDFDGNVGDTVTIRKPATFTAQEYNRANGITVQNATEGSTSVSLDTLLDVSFEVTSEEWTLDIKDFQAQFLAPAMEAFNQKVDQMLIGLTADVAQTVDDPGGTHPAYQLVDAKQVLTDAKVPASQRYTVLGTKKASEFTKDPLFHEADKRGDTSGLIEASIGRKFGFDNYESQNETTDEGIAFHRDAFSLVSRTLAIPRGVATSQASVANYKGLGLRVIYDYDNDKKADVVSLDVLVGVKTLDAAKAAILSAPPAA